MKTIARAKAKLYIKAGFFPRITSTEEICDLQDAFGHLPYRFNLNLLADDDEEIRRNAETLFRLIWSDETVDTYLGEARKYMEEKRRANELYDELEKLEASIKRFEFNEDLE